MFREETRFVFGMAADAGRASGDQCRFPQRACCGPGLKDAGVPVQDSNLTWLWRAGGGHKSMRPPIAGSAMRPELQFSYRTRSAIYNLARSKRAKKEPGPKTGARWFSMPLWGTASSPEGNMPTRTTCLGGRLRRAGHARNIAPNSSHHNARSRMSAMQRSSMSSVI
jgi:hypothetical protein